MDYKQKNSMVTNKLRQIANNQAIGISVVSSREGVVSHSQVNDIEVNSPVQIGCLAKTLTSILAAVAEMDGLLKLEDRLEEHLPVSGRFSGLTLGHLLNQTSGVDQSLITSLPRQPGGLIQREVLLAQLESSAVFSEPGTMFHYGNVGPWLVAAILEKHYGLTYAALLEARLFKPLGICMAGNVESDEICPSMGMGLQLSAHDLSAIMSLHLDGSAVFPAFVPSLARLRNAFGFVLSGSVMMAIRAYPGWFDYGNSYGQLGHGENTSAVIRLVPDQKMVIAITAEHPQLAYMALAVLYRECLAEFSTAASPRLMSAKEWARINPEIYTGCYENGRYRLLLDVARNGALRARVYGKKDDASEEDSAPCIKRYFKAADGDSFIPVEPEPTVCPVLKFSKPLGDVAGFRYVSTGSYVFTRSDQWQQSYGL